jgi:NADH-quinone oxidoreductase subunit A
MSSSLAEYVAAGTGLLLAAGIAFAILLLNAWLGPKRLGTAHRRPFECGNEGTGPIRDRFNVKYYLVGLVFLALDVEVVFLLPWAVEYRRLLADPAVGALVFGEAIIFIAVLAAALLYVIKRRAIDWD